MAENKNEKVCSKCGANLVEGIMFCPSCGAPVAQVEEKTEKVAEVAEEKTEAAVETAEEKAEEVVEAVEEKAEAAVDVAEEKVEETAETVKDATVETAASVEEKVEKPVAEVKEAVQTPAASQTGNEEESELMKKIKAFGTAKLAAILGGILAVIIVIAIIVSNHKTTINLEDYVKVEVEGYDESGEATVEWKGDLDKAIADALGYKDGDDIKDSVKAYAEYLEIMDSISLKADKTEDLSNGDKIKVTIKYDNDVAGEHGIKFKGETYEMTVKGLEELREVDPFDGLTVSYDGKAPYARVKFEYTGSEDFISSYYFTADKEDELKAGDKITVTCEISDYTLEDEKVKLSSTTKEYTVENVESYLTTLAEVESDALENLKKETEDVITSYFAGEKEYIKQDGLTYAGCYLLKDKDGSSWYGYNTLYVIYSANVSSKEKGSDKKFKTTKVYFPVKYTEIVKGVDGTVTWERNDYSDIQGETKLEYSWWSKVKGYTDGKDMYDDLISPNKADYDYEISASLQSFGN